jgi:hypothetical protein
MAKTNKGFTDNGLIYIHNNFDKGIAIDGLLPKHWW